MGSLTSGWNSENLHKRRGITRKKTQTEKQIEAALKEQNKKGDEDSSGSERGSPRTSMDNGSFPGSPASSPLDKTVGEILAEAAAVPAKPSKLRSSSTDSDPRVRVEGFPVNATEQDKKDWWQKSNLAFLNEPPSKHVPGEVDRYTAQFEVANIVATGNAGAH